MKPTRQHQPSSPSRQFSLGHLLKRFVCMPEHKLLGCVPPVCWISVGRRHRRRGRAPECCPRTHNTLQCTRQQRRQRRLARAPAAAVRLAIGSGSSKASAMTATFAWCTIPSTRPCSKAGRAPGGSSGRSWRRRVQAQPHHLILMAKPAPPHLGSAVRWLPTTSCRPAQTRRAHAAPQKALS